MTCVNHLHLVPVKSPPSAYIPILSSFTGCGCPSCSSNQQYEGVNRIVVLQRRRCCFGEQTPPGTPRMSDARRKIRRVLNKFTADDDYYGWRMNFHHCRLPLIIMRRHFDNRCWIATAFIYSSFTFIADVVKFFLPRDAVVAIQARRGVCHGISVSVRRWLQH